MLAPVLMLALALPLQGSSSRSDATTGAYLFRTCQAAVRLMDHPDSNSPDLTKALSCMSYFEGFIDGENTGGLRLCFDLKRDESNAAIIRIYVTYMEKHPKAMEMPKGVGAYLALTQKGALSCAVK